MLLHSYVERPFGFDVVAEDTEEGDRGLLKVLSLYPSDPVGNTRELARLLCHLLDGLAVRDAEGLAPADWVEIGTDDEDEPDLYAEAYDEGFKDGSAAAFELAAEDDEDEDSEEGDGYYGYGDY